MTILSRVVWPGGELTVCGTPSKAWLEWLRTTDTPLTADQIRWRDCDFTVTPPAAAIRQPRRPAQFDLIDTEEL